MKQTISIIIFLIFPFSFQVFASDCDFMKGIDNLLKIPPEVAVQSNKFGEDTFLSVADGFSPSRPGFDSGEELGCAMKNYEFHMVLAGADSYQCKGQGTKASQANKYAEKYNIHLKQSLVENGRFKCMSILLAEKRNKLCEATGQELCTGLEDWSGALSALTKYVWSLNRTSTVGYLPEKYGEYSASIREPEHRKKILENACEIFPRFGSKMDVTIHIKLANYNRNKGEWDEELMPDVVCKQ